MKAGSQGESKSLWDDAFCSQRYVDTAILSSLLRLKLPARASERIARELVVKFGSLAAVARASPTQWLNTSEVTPECVNALSLMKATIVAATKAPENRPSVLEDWSGFVARLQGQIGNTQQETFVAVFLNARLCVLGEKVIAQGTVNAAAVYPREVLRAALEVAANSMILVHNHPSGNLRPSREDIVLTKDIIEAGAALGLGVYDHLIVTSGGYTSLRRLGLLEAESSQSSLAGR